MRMSNLLGGTSAYAHLAGLVPVRGARPAARSSARRAEEDEDEKDARADGDPDQYPDKDDSKPSGKGRRSRAEGDDDDKDARAEEEEDDKEASDGDEDEDDRPAARRARARAEDEDDDTEASEDDDEKEEMSGKSAVAAARRRERARCKAIFSHPAAATNLALAASLAFDTTQTRKEALAVLKGQGAAAPAHGVRADRRARNPDLGSGGDTAPTGQQAQASSWDRALHKAGVAPVRK